MDLFKVYPLFDIEIEKGKGSVVYDNTGIEYLDLYGGHAVISIGHSHPTYIERITNQLGKIGFYSNSVQIPIQQQVAQKLGEISGREDYSLFFCNSGAEANENALKLASFHNGKKKIISFTKGFHGRTSLAVAATDNKNIVAPVNETDNTIILPHNDIAALEEAFRMFDVSSVILEGIQGIGGIYLPSQEFVMRIRELCDENNAVFIADSIQDGYGRTGKFFGMDHFNVTADIYTMAKGMGNGFPIGGILISPIFEAKFGLLGTTFGGNHLACAAAMAVLEVIENEKLIENSEKIGNYLIEELNKIEGIQEVRGKGLMIGIDLPYDAAPLRKKLLTEQRIFTGSASSKNTIRLLPPMCLTQKQAEKFIEKFKIALNSLEVE